jgi:hypothetical protein
MASTTPQKAFEARAKAEAAEYSTYQAVAPIYHDGVVAYQPGHAVPVSNVEAYGYHNDGLVKKLTGEAAQQAAQTSPFVGDGGQPQPE